MKIKTALKSYKEAMALAGKREVKVKRPMFILRLLVRILSFFELKKVKFKYKKTGMEKLGKKEPCLFLMNHSSFIDLKIASAMLFPRRYNIVCTYDAFVGKRWLMRNLGCIPTSKFVPDLSLVKNMSYALKKLKSSVLMFPEACYSFDGTATVLSDSLGRCIKRLGVPVVMIRTNGAFARDPLYNNLQLRRVNVSAEMEYILSPSEIQQKTADEINLTVNKYFDFDGFRWQQENNVIINEPFRADCLNRVLYKCPSCLAEGEMVGKGTTLVCSHCKKEYELTENGYIRATDGKTEFDHVPSWYRWQRDCVRKEIENGSYYLSVEVNIAMLVDTKCLYIVGDGRLTHNSDGFTLCGCDGELSYSQKPLSTYTLNADYYWYEIGDVICIGDNSVLYYCFPKSKGDIVTKTRLATEELYKKAKSSIRGNAEEGKTVESNKA